MSEQKAVLNMICNTKYVNYYNTWLQYCVFDDKNKLEIRKVL